VYNQIVERLYFKNYNDHSIIIGSFLNPIHLLNTFDNQYDNLYGSVVLNIEKVAFAWWRRSRMRLLRSALNDRSCLGICLIKNNRQLRAECGNPTGGGDEALKSLCALVNYRLITIILSDFKGLKHKKEANPKWIRFFHWKSKLLYGYL